jgi:hypothetical protein
LIRVTTLAASNPSGHAIGAKIYEWDPPSFALLANGGELRRVGKKWDER